MNRSGSVADLDALIAFQKELIKLSDDLVEIHIFLSRDLNELSNHWQDRKFIEFEQNFAPKRDEIKRISESYRTWANTSLQETILRLSDILDTSMY